VIYGHKTILSNQRGDGITSKTNSSHGRKEGSIFIPKCAHLVVHLFFQYSCLQRSKYCNLAFRIAWKFHYVRCNFIFSYSSSIKITSIQLATSLFNNGLLAWLIKFNHKRIKYVTTINKGKDTAGMLWEKKQVSQRSTRWKNKICKFIFIAHVRISRKGYAIRWHIWD
jgi:hypothetical protein